VKINKYLLHFYLVDKDDKKTYFRSLAAYDPECDEKFAPVMANENLVMMLMHLYSLHREIYNNLEVAFPEWCNRKKVSDFIY
jgi:hypothetical protein